MKLRWTDDLATGVRQIDLQHQELIEIINDLEDGLEAGSELGTLNDGLLRLTSYVMFHFATEETLMRDKLRNKEHQDHHLNEHRAFTEKITRLKSEVMEGDARANLADLVNFLKGWLVEHINKTDKALSLNLKR